MSELSNQQIIDTAGDFASVAVSHAGAEHVQFDDSGVPSPPYEVVAADFSSEDRQFTIPSQAVTQLARYPGLRVTVGVMVPARGSEPRPAYFPGIVLDTEGRDPLLGILKAPPDALTDQTSLEEHLTSPLPDLQHILLQRLYGLQAPNTGEHTAGDSINVVESAHGVLIAVANAADLSGLHGRVHDYVTDGLAKSISAPSPQGVGSADIKVNGRMRQVRDDVVPARGAFRIIVSREHQLPLKNSLPLDMGQLVVGTTLAAVRSKRAAGFPQPNLQAGIDAMLAEG